MVSKPTTNTDKIYVPKAHVTNLSKHSALSSQQVQLQRPKYDKT